MKYKVCIMETLLRVVAVDANTEDDALKIIEDKYNKAEIVLDVNDFVDKEIYVSVN